MPEFTTNRSHFRRSWVKLLATKAASLLVAGLLMGWAYQWAEPRLYGVEKRACFTLGVVHGALMPIALPSLLMGNDAAIYAPNNSGRGYKIGYICGINLCGLLFFGMAFRKPLEDKGGPAQKNQFR